MMKNFFQGLAQTLGTVALAAAATGCATTDSFYVQRNLVSDTPSIPAEQTDPQLVNPWGVAFNPFGVVWVSDNGTGVSTLYDGNGIKQTLVVTIPPLVAGETGNPTGIVFYGGPGFVVTSGGASAPARFIFSSEDGTITAWAPAVNPTVAIRVATTPGAIYKGLAVGAGGTGPLLYATDFRNAKVDVFDTNFNPVTLPGTPFRDPTIPDGFAPFGIQAIGGDIYVTYAKQDEEREDDVTGPGRGYVSVFDPNGVFQRRLISRGQLNAPWGLALAPASFGKFGNRLLVGNFGDGRINAYDPATGKFVGALKGVDGMPIVIEGLWGIQFGNGLNSQPTNTLFFAAGPDDEEHGLYGRLDVARGDVVLKAEDKK